jgi:hypothetical protein
MINKIEEFKPKNVKLINRYSKLEFDINNYETIKLQHKEGCGKDKNGIIWIDIEK